VPADSSRARRPAIGGPGYILLAAATVSRLAVNTAPIALVLLTIARTLDGRLAGLLVAAFTVPTLIAGPVLGAYLDQLRRKRLLFAVSQAVLATDLAAVLILAGHVSGWLLAALTLVAGATAPVLTGGYSSLVPLAIPPAALGRANAWFLPQPARSRCTRHPARISPAGRRGAAWVRQLVHTHLMMATGRAVARAAGLNPPAGLNQMCLERPDAGGLIRARGG
jgi:hypothetical protein